MGSALSNGHNEKDKPLPNKINTVDRYAPADLFVENITLISTSMKVTILTACTQFIYPPLLPPIFFTFLSRKMQ
jgi:hypothetical protein